MAPRDICFAAIICSHAAIASPSNKAVYVSPTLRPSPTIVGHSWDLQDILGPDCAPPLGLSDEDRHKGVSKELSRLSVTEY